MALYLIAGAGLLYYMYNLNKQKPNIPDGPAFVVVHSPHCGHCIAMMPEFDKLGAVVSGVPVKKVNGLEQRELAEALGTTAYPHIVFIKPNKELVEFNGERTADNFIAFINNNK
jgi:thiol-disulfide isomerase/thioredoxin